MLQNIYDAERLLSNHSAQKDGASRSYTTTQESLYHIIDSKSDDRCCIVDFDETLWLRNSTEMFLASIKPCFIVSILLQIVSLLRPWKLHGSKSHDYRDLYRIKLVLLLFPSSVKRWNEVAKELGPKYLNEPLYNKLVSRGVDKVYIVSYGYDFILKPLVDSFEGKLQLSVCSTLKTAVHLRKIGKAKAVIHTLGSDVLKQSIVITDSLLDKDLLESCHTGALVVWPDAVYKQAGLTPMLPLAYTRFVKRPSMNYFITGVIGQDYVALLLIFACFSEQPFTIAASLFFLLLSYFSVYEIGYYENDVIGLQHEEQSTISDAYHHYVHCFKPYFAWLCAILLAGLGSWIVRDASIAGESLFTVEGSHFSVLVMWLAFILFLLTVRVIFAWFNRIKVKGRFLPMLFLQLARFLGFAIFFSTSVAGMIFCVSLALSRWIPYAIYRFDGDRKGFPAHLTTFLIWSVFTLSLLFTPDFDLNFLFDFHTLLIFSYLAARAARDLLKFREHLSFLY